MGDRRYVRPLEKIMRATARDEAIHGLTDEEVVQALAAVSRVDTYDPYLANVLATEAMNRVQRAGTITRTAAEALVSLDALGRITHANPAAALALRLDAESLMGSHHDEHLVLVRGSGEPLPAERSPVQHVLETGESVLHQEVHFRRSDGEVFPALASVAPIQRADQVEGAVLAFIDITERKQAEEAVRAERKRLYRILDNLSEGVLLVSAEGTYEYANPSALRIMELDARDLIGRTVRDVPVTMSVLEGGASGRDARPSLRVLSSGEALHGERLRLRGKRGRETIIEVDANPIHDPEGRFVGAVLSFDDVTQRLAAEERDHLLASLVEHSADAILHEALDGTILSWNKAAERLLGHKADEIVGQHVSRVIPLERRHELHTVNGRVAQGEQVPSYDTERLAKDGRRVSVNLTVSPVRDAKGRIRSLSTTYRDISERKQAEARIQRLVALYEALQAAQGRLDVAYFLLEGERIAAANDAFARLVGRTTDDLLALPSVLDLAPEDARAALRERMEKARAGSATKGELFPLRSEREGVVRVELAFQRVPGEKSVIGIARERAARPPGE